MVFDSASSSLLALPRREILVTETHLPDTGRVLTMLATSSKIRKRAGGRNQTSINVKRSYVVLLNQQDTRLQRSAQDTCSPRPECSKTQPHQRAVLYRIRLVGVVIPHSWWKQNEARIHASPSAPIRSTQFTIAYSEDNLTI